MSVFNVGDRVIVRRQHKSYYSTEEAYDSFPGYMEGKETLVESVYDTLYPIFHKVKGCNVSLLEFELSRINPVLDKEAEWE